MPGRGIGDIETLNLVHYLIWNAVLTQMHSTSELFRELYFHA